MNRPLALLAAMLLCIPPTTTQAIDLTAIDRSIKKEPGYQTQPRYCLLVFGKEARSQVWLVVDGRRLYIDRNGNGDLTEPGEWVKSNTIARSFEQIVKADGTTGRENDGMVGSFHVDHIREADRATVHKNFRLSVYDHDRFDCSIDLAEGGGRSVGGRSVHPKPRLAARAKDAPIIHFNGPMTFARVGLTLFLERPKARYGFRTIRVLIGSPGLGEGTFARREFGAWLGRDDYRMATADFEFPSNAAGGGPMTRRGHLKLRDCWDYGYCSTVRAPTEAGAGFAKVTLSMPDSKHGEIKPGTFKMLIIGSPRDVPTLAAAIQTEDTVVRKKIKYLFRYDRFHRAGNEVLQALVEQFDTTDRAARIGALYGLTEWKTGQVLTLLKRAIDDPDVKIRAAAIRALRGHNDPTANVVPKLLAALSDEDRMLRRSAAYALHGYAPHSPAAARALVKSLDDADHEVRANAAGSLGVKGPESLKALPKIAPLLHDREPDVRSAAARAIAGIDRTAIPPLIDNLKSSAGNRGIIRELASAALRTMDARLRYQSGKVTDIRFYDPPRKTEPSDVTSDDLKVLRQLADIEELNDLRKLNLSHSQITDDGLRHIENLTNLTFLGLAGTQVTDDGLVHLKKLKNLTVLHMSRTRITSAGLAHITHMQQLEILDLRESSVDDAAAVHIAKLKKLDAVFLSGARSTKKEKPN